MSYTTEEMQKVNELLEGYLSSSVPMRYDELKVAFGNPDIRATIANDHVLYSELLSLRHRCEKDFYIQQCNLIEHKAMDLFREYGCSLEDLAPVRKNNAHADGLKTHALYESRLATLFAH